MLCEYKAVHTNLCLSPGHADTPSRNVELSFGEGGSSSDGQEPYIVVKFSWIGGK